MTATKTCFRLLVADDDRFIRDFLQRNLSGSEYDVTCVPSGDEAVARLGQERFAALFVDLHMEGIGGRQTIEKVRAIDPDMPILVMTGDETLGTEREIRHLGVFYYFIKPLEIGEIRQVLFRALRGAR